MSNVVFVLDTNRKPLTPCKPGVARSLLNAGKAAIFRRDPFTIVLKKVVATDPAPLELKLDPGSKCTGIALKREDQISFGAEREHRGQQIRNALLSRRHLRCARRSRTTRSRHSHVLNRTRPDGWLAPSLQHRAATVLTWVNRLRRRAPIGSIVQELVRFDTQRIQNAESSGVEYQQGELQGYDVRQYLLEQWGRTCVYCGAQTVPREIEHIHPKSTGGSDRVSNLTWACHDCNQRKDNRDIRAFLANKPDLLKRIVQQAQTPLREGPP